MVLTQRKKIFFTLTLAAALVLLAAGKNFFSSEPTSGLTTTRVCLSKDCVTAEIADTAYTVTKGLMHRDYLCPDCGMLFVFDEPGAHRFWMKNTLIPLDMIWMDEDKNVVHISRDALPCKSDPCPNYGPDTKIKYVLEVNAGYADEKHVDVGETARFSLQKNR